MGCRYLRGTARIFGRSCSIVFFPYKGQLLVRTDVARLNITDEAYRRYYSKRFDIYGSNRSTSTRIHQRLEEAQWEFAQPLANPEDATEDQPPTAVTLAEPDEEIPPPLETTTRVRRTKAWTHYLPAPRIIRSRATLSAMSCQLMKSIRLRLTGKSWRSEGSRGTPLQAPRSMGR